jgi:type IV secretory pathway protease TraF
MLRMGRPGGRSSGSLMIGTVLVDLVKSERTVPVVAELDHGITLKDNEYFIVGDSPWESKDSRYIGPIKKSSIFGKVIEIKSK